MQENIIRNYLWLQLKFIFNLSWLLYFSFLSLHFGNLQLPIFYFSSHTSQLKLIKFNEFNKILKLENRTVSWNFGTIQRLYEVKYIAESGFVSLDFFDTVLIQCFSTKVYQIPVWLNYWDKIKFWLSVQSDNLKLINNWVFYDKRFCQIWQIYLKVNYVIVVIKYVLKYTHSAKGHLK